MPQKQTTKNQHFVPRTYLKKFSNNGLLDRCFIQPYKVERGKSIKKHLCCEDWFYEFYTYDKNRDEFEKTKNLLETKLQIVETRYGTLYQRLMVLIEDAINTNEPVKMTKGEVHFLKEFMALQSIRTKKAFENAEEIIESCGINIGTLPEDLKRTLIIPSLFPETIRQHHLSRDCMYNEMLKLLNDPQTIMIFITPEHKGDRFLTSDHPVCFMSDNDWNGFLFPINEKIAIFAYNTFGQIETEPFMVVKQNHDQMKQQNETIIQNANEYVMAQNLTKEELELIKNTEILEHK